MQKIFSRPIYMIRRGVDSLCDPVSSQANYNYLQHKAAPRVSWRPAQAENCWAGSGAEINVVSEKNGQVNTFTG